MSDPAATPSEDTPAPDIHKQALKAFKKRLKLTLLDMESRLGYGPMTKGSRIGKLGIQPPNQFPLEVWQELARRGKIRYVRDGLYELMDGA